MSNRMLAFSVAVLLLAGTLPAQAWGIRECNGDDRIQWREAPLIRASDMSFPVDRLAAGALQNVLVRWNGSPADFRFGLRFNEPRVLLGNEENEVWFSDDPETLDGAPSVAFSWDDCGIENVDDKGLVETDVVFACDPDVPSCDGLDEDDKVDWGFGTTKTFFFNYGGELRPFRTTAMHEFGHALGLEHETSEYNVMGRDWTHLHVYGATATAYPGEDASDGAVELYGPSDTPREDVSVTHWKYEGADGGYSVHVRTVVKDAGGNPLPCDPYDEGDVDPCDESDDDTEDEPRYLVDNGQEVQVEFSFENNGSSDHDGVPVAFFLSNNTTFGFGDRRIGSRWPHLHRNGVYTTATSVQLPNDLTSGGTYYILAVVDEGDTIDEVDENNNATYVGIKVN